MTFSMNTTTWHRRSSAVSTYPPPLPRSRPHRVRHPLRPKKSRGRQRISTALPNPHHFSLTEAMTSKGVVPTRASQ
jgi:hypothetical protein